MLSANRLLVNAFTLAYRIVQRDYKSLRDFCSLIIIL